MHLSSMPLCYHAFHWIHALLHTHWNDMEPASKVQRVGLCSLSFLKSCFAWLWYCWRSRPNWTDGGGGGEKKIWSVTNRLTHNSHKKYGVYSGQEIYWCMRCLQAALTRKRHYSSTRKDINMSVIFNCTKIAIGPQSRFHTISIGVHFLPCKVCLK